MNKVLKLTGISALKVAKDTRSYYAATFQDPANPFASTVTRMFWQQLKDGVAYWKGADYEVIKGFVGKTVPGFISTQKVEPFMIGDRSVSTYTTVILGSELEEQVFKALGHIIAQPAIAAPIAVAAQPAAPAVAADVAIV